MAKIVRADDVERAFKEGKKGIILNFQNLAHIGLGIEKLEFYYHLGIRIMQLTYNTRNYIGNGCIERRDEGLSYFGLEVVDKLNRLGVLIDLSHCGPKTSMDAIEASRDPVAFTHTFAKKLNDHVRGKDDELLQAIAEKGGYIGVLAVPGFITSKPTATLDDLLDQVDYIVNLVGVNHVGIGSDIGDRMPDELAKKLNEELLPQLGFKPEHRADYTIRTVGLEDWRLWPNIVKGLISRGYSSSEVKKIIGENFLKVFKRVVG